ncbi:MAG TPA: zf-HC2 domain-containing protein [Verrucomicrobiae bacterium]|nr:zf-HC2 domain-containing protein [Verrucomicrobiae bacterium]
MVLICRDFVEFLDDYLFATLGEERRAVFEAHLAVCPPCVSYMKSYLATIRLEKAAFDAPDQPVPSEVPEDLVQAILKARDAKG